MTMASKIHRGLDVAVFTRNHRRYLNEACKIAAKRPGQRITFRAKTRWAAAAKALQERKPRYLYIAPIGAEGVVEFVADLYSVHLDPEYAQPRTKELLALVLDSTKEEGLWDNAVGTLYVIQNCRQLERPFPMTSLIKVSDDKPIGEDYGYSYSIVYPREHG